MDTETVEPIPASSLPMIEPAPEPPAPDPTAGFNAAKSAVTSSHPTPADIDPSGLMSAETLEQVTAALDLDDPFAPGPLGISPPVIGNDAMFTHLGGLDLPVPLSDAQKRNIVIVMDNNGSGTVTAGGFDGALERGLRKHLLGPEQPAASDPSVLTQADIGYLKDVLDWADLDAYGVEATADPDNPAIAVEDFRGYLTAEVFPDPVDWPKIDTVLTAMDRNQSGGIRRAEFDAAIARDFAAPDTPLAQASAEPPADDEGDDIPVVSTADLRNLAVTEGAPIPELVGVYDIPRHKIGTFTAPADGGVFVIVAKSHGAEKNTVDADWFLEQGEAQFLGSSGSSDKAAGLFFVPAGVTVRMPLGGSRDLLVFETEQMSLLNPGPAGISDNGYGMDVTGHPDADVTIGLDDEGKTKGKERHYLGTQNAAEQTYFPKGDDRILFYGPGEFGPVPAWNVEEGVFVDEDSNPNNDNQRARLDGALVHISFG